MNNLTASQLRQAADLQEKIAKLRSQLDAILNSGFKATFKIAKPAKKKMSAAGRARIAAARKTRWAKIKGKCVDDSNTTGPRFR